MTSYKQQKRRNREAEERLDKTVAELLRQAKLSTRPTKDAQ